jgi:hypothetical protein
MVERFCRLASTSLVPQMMQQLRAQHTLDQCLLERHGSGPDRLSDHRAFNELVIHFLGMVGIPAAAAAFVVFLLA